MTATKDTILVTGGAGFIGSNFVLRWIENVGTPVVNLDLLTYAGNPANLARARRRPTLPVRACRYLRRRSWSRLHSKSIARAPSCTLPPKATSIAPSSIRAPSSRPTCRAPTPCWSRPGATGRRSTRGAKTAFRFLHVSTDEVYGTLGPDDPPFSETTPYAPNSPYAASKAASDHLARAYFHTYKLPVLTTNCSNNYGPFQFPEKLIPLMILNALEGKPLPVYGDGQNVRDWLFVDDHCSAIRTVLERGRPGETYNIGGNSEREQSDVVKTICDLVDELRPDATIGPRRKLITFVTDRPGHDRRYAIDARKSARTRLAAVQ